MVTWLMLLFIMLTLLLDWLLISLWELNGLWLNVRNLNNITGRIPSVSFVLILELKHIITSINIQHSPTDCGVMTCRTAAIHGSFGHFLLLP